MALALLAGIGTATAAAPAGAAVVELGIPSQWYSYEMAPTEPVQLIDVGRQAPARLIEEVVILEAGDALEVRAKLLMHNVPSSFARLRTTLVQIADAHGEPISVPAADLGTP
ncbi:hypothetical protein [Microbacterium album]|uniref:hypothetical protein n=1 Tax=Microbacterium album TaxID=2053191 RepID=UPI0016652A13|nr:hypothetical protein [Microbacterium album]